MKRIGGFVGNAPEVWQLFSIKLRHSIMGHPISKLNVLKFSAHLFCSECATYLLATKEEINAVKAEHARLSPDEGGLWDRSMYR